MSQQLGLNINTYENGNIVTVGDCSFVVPPLCSAGAGGALPPYFGKWAGVNHPPPPQLSRRSVRQMAVRH